MLIQLFQDKGWVKLDANHSHLLRQGLFRPDNKRLFRGDHHLHVKCAFPSRNLDGQG